ncbi:MAG: zinc-binding protein [Chrysiogenales bacterium]|nr:MAG: zinc-binding protein [Chrysiogenales bacterium]
MADNCCETGMTLLYTCSGASDVGELADRAVRKLWKKGYAQKTCLAGVGADISGFALSAQTADINITVDGCHMACARKCLERIGVTPVAVMLGDLGFAKGESPVTEEKAEGIAELVRERVAAHSSTPGSGA